MGYDGAGRRRRGDRLGRHAATTTTCATPAAPPSGSPSSSTSSTASTARYDDWGHGTHVAGIIAGNGYDSHGTRAGIAPAATLVALKALDGAGRGRISSIIQALDWAVANRAAYNIRVVNMSLGAGVFESYNTDPLTLAAKRAVDAGIVVVAAAGNIGLNASGDPQYGAITAPANAPWVLTVGASNANGTARRNDDTMAPFSSRGPTAIDFVAKPDVVAPGTERRLAVQPEQQDVRGEGAVPGQRLALDDLQAVPQAERHQHGRAGRQRHGGADAAGQPAAHAQPGQGASCSSRPRPTTATTTSPRAPAS